PELDGTEVCREIRKHGALPIVFLSSNDDEIDRVLGLEMGGDDYVTKPFSPRELVARIKAVLRRATPVAASAAEPGSAAAAESKKALRAGAIELDTEQVRVFVDDSEVTLTATEFGILRTLLGFVGKAYTRNELMNGAYGHGTYVSDRTIDSHVRRIRQKLGVHGESIETVHGVGYRLRG
ncbi:MAG: two-component system OmpR family response regulator, partial [Flavobacteriales bacterium]